MLRSLKEMRGYAVTALDGNVGQVHDFFFDDDQWIVRFLVVSTGSWLAKKRVLISPVALQEANWLGRQLHVNLSRAQVEKSPDVDVHKPVSRQQEVRLHDHYGWPYYWAVDGWGVWNPGAIGPYPPQTDKEMRIDRERSQDEDPHLRSSGEVMGYHVHARDESFGHIEDFIIDDESWTFRYLVIDTKNWWFGKKVLISTAWVDHVRWHDREIDVDLNGDTIKNGPEYDPGAPINREYEARLYDFYGRPSYWDRDVGRYAPPL
jgi:hypothetical protein